MIEFTIPGKPIPKASVRVGKHGGYYDKKSKTAAYMQAVALHARRAMAGTPPMVGPVEVVIIVVRTVPVGWSGKKKAAAWRGEVLPVTKPDVDNYCKAILDGMSGVVYRDDNQVVKLRAEKKFGDKPEAYVRVTAIEP